MLTDFRRLLDAVAVGQAWKPGEIRSRIFRHTYSAARLQPVDQRALVSTYRVAREMGHGGETMVRNVYEHLDTCATGLNRYSTASSSTTLS